MKKNILFILTSLLIAIILIYFVFKKIGTKEIWQVFLSFPPKGILLCLLLTILSVALGSWRWQIILKDRGYNIPISKLSSVWMSGFGWAYFTSMGGMIGDELLKSYTLKNRFSISLRKAAASVVIEDPILDGSIFFLIIIIGIFFFILKTMVIPLELWMVILILSFPIGGLIFFYFKAFKTQSMIKIIEKPLKKLINGKLAEGINDLEKEILDFFKVDNKSLWQAITISFLKGIITVARSWLIILFLGIKIDFIAAISIVAFANIAYIFPLPAALGSLEALEAFAFSNFGLAPHNAIAFTLILRFFDLSVALIGIFFLFRFSTTWVKEKIGL